MRLCTLVAPIFGDIFPPAKESAGCSWLPYTCIRVRNGVPVVGSNYTMLYVAFLCLKNIAFSGCYSGNRLHWAATRYQIIRTIELHDGQSIKSQVVYFWYKSTNTNYASYYFLVLSLPRWTIPLQGQSHPFGVWISRRLIGWHLSKWLTVYMSTITVRWRECFKTMECSGKHENQTKDAYVATTTQVGQHKM